MKYSLRLGKILLIGAALSMALPSYSMPLRPAWMTSNQQGARPIPSGDLRLNPQTQGGPGNSVPIPGSLLLVATGLGLMGRKFLKKK